MFSAVALVAIVVLLVLMKPRLVLNESVLLFFADLIFKETGTAVTWTAVDIQAESVSFFKKRVSLDFTGPCVRRASLDRLNTTAYSGCFDRIRVTATGGLVHLLPKISEAGPIAIENGKVLVDLDQFKREPKKENPKPFRIEEVLPVFLRGAKVHPIELDISRFEIREKRKSILGHLRLFEKNSQINLTGHAAAQNESYDLSLRLVNDMDFWAWNHWNVRGQARGRFEDGRSVQLALDISPRFVPVGPPVRKKWRLKRATQEEAVALDFSLRGKTSKNLPSKNFQSIEANLNGSYVPGKLNAKISASARYLIPEISRLSLKACGLNIEKQAPRGESRYRLDCGVVGSLPISQERLKFLEIPEESSLRVQADLTSSDFIPSDATQFEGNVDVVATPIRTPLFQGKGEVHGRLAGVIGEFPRTGQVDSHVAIELRIPDFQRLSRKLSKTAWGIPAPFQALEGDVTFRTAGGSNLEQGLFPLRLQTRLRSASQNMNLDAAGTMEMTDIRTDLGTQLNFALTLSDLKILLPRLKLEQPPRVIPDDRIHSLSQAGHEQLKEAPREESAFGYRAVIRTPPGKPVQVITNLAKTPIPVNLNINLSSETKPEGEVRINSFEVEAFRRKATVRRFDIDLVPKIGDSSIDGRIDVPLGDYLTHIDLVGSIDKPQVKVSSDPPIGEDQLLAALLFNRTPEELDPNESAAVGSTRATVSQGALSLASLFLLASTPIEGLTYNPDTGQVTAQVRLSEGLSLNVGSGEKQAGAVGLRKRIGSNFFVTTNVNNIIQDTSTVSAYLEWRKRY